MLLLPREEAKLSLHLAGSLAQKRLARGLKLNITESKALIASVLHELVRDGRHSVAELMNIGKTILGRRQVQKTVAAQLHEIQIEGTFPDGTFLVTVHEPISSSDGNLELALYGSFLPVPAIAIFGEEEPQEIAGQVVVAKAAGIKLNQGRDRVRLKVTNLGDRPIQVGSHYHFAETNRSLSFDRGLALATRLDIAAGTAVRFEPGESKTVTLVRIAGECVVSGGNGLYRAANLPKSIKGVDGDTLRQLRKQFEEYASQLKFAHITQADALTGTSVTGAEISREAYAGQYGPTTGDRVRLADTALWIQVERDLTSYGDECKFGGGKVLREGMGQATGRPDAETLDLVITNALIVDWTGIYKADIGVKHGRIVGIGKAGNPDVMDGVTPNMICGSNTEAIAGEKLIITAGAIDAHVHFICPQLCDEALASGITTVVGGGTGPSAGTSATTCTPSRTYVQAMMSAMDGIPLNTLLTGKGNDSGPDGLIDMVKSGCAGLKLHEDWGSTPSAIDNCLTVCDEYDVQCNIHTDTLNESCFFEDTMAAINGRAIQFYHVEGAGGGHAPDIIAACGHDNVLPSSTNPTMPYCKNTLDEHLDMLMVCHHLDKSIPEDIAFAESRIRGETVAAEDVLHDEGAISMISSDSQAMGRIGEVISRTWRTASKMRSMRGVLKGDTSESDNTRVKRYVSKYTINVALTHGISEHVGSIEVGKLADLCLWEPANFGARPKMVIKGGHIAWAQVGDANASIPTVEPVNGRPMFASYPKAAALCSLSFVSQLSIDSGLIESYRLAKKAVAVKGCRKVGKKDMKWNAELPKITVDPETYRVEADGVHMAIEPATKLPLTQGYFLF